MNYINTNSYWDELGAIASECLSDIENSLYPNETNTDLEIETTRGTLYWDKEEHEIYLNRGDKQHKDEVPLREQDTQDILIIADEINDWISENEKE